MALGRTNFLLFSAAFTVQRPIPPPSSASFSRLARSLSSSPLFLTVWCRTDEKILCPALFRGSLLTRARKTLQFRGRRGFFLPNCIMVSVLNVVPSLYQFNLLMPSAHSVPKMHCCTSNKTDFTASVPVTKYHTPRA